MEDERGLNLEGKGELVVGTRMKGQQTRRNRRRMDTWPKAGT